MLFPTSILLLPSKLKYGNVGAVRKRGPTCGPGIHGCPLGKIERGADHIRYGNVSYGAGASTAARSAMIASQREEGCTQISLKL
jgi:hypothetical protein